MTDSEEHAYSFSVEDFDKSLLPPHARTPGTDAFREEVNKSIQKDFAEFTGWVRIVVGSETIQVTWRQDPNRPTPMQVALGKIQHGEFPDAIRILEHLRRQEPDDLQVLYNLGLALSDSGHPHEAEACLRHALDVAPDYANAMTALGVALVRQERTAEAIEVLREAVAREPNNAWGQRNLGGCLLSIGRTDEAVLCLRRAYELAPKDQQAVFGYAQALHAKGDLAEADALYGEAISLDERSPVAELARRARTGMAELSFRMTVPAGVRPDGVSYCLNALRQFSRMMPEQVKKLGFEIAVLGQRGLDTNSPDQQYTLKSLPGKFSGLQLLCMMFVAL